jgi:hypothetical protein
VTKTENGNSIYYTVRKDDDGTYRVVFESPNPNFGTTVYANGIKDLETAEQGAAYLADQDAKEIYMMMSRECWVVGDEAEIREIFLRHWAEMKEADGRERLEEFRRMDS